MAGLAPVDLPTYSQNPARSRVNLTKNRRFACPVAGTDGSPPVVGQSVRDWPRGGRFGASGGCGSTDTTASTGSVQAIPPGAFVHTHQVSAFLPSIVRRNLCAVAHTMFLRKSMAAGIVKPCRCVDAHRCAVSVLTVSWKSRLRSVVLGDDIVPVVVPSKAPPSLGVLRPPVEPGVSPCPGLRSRVMDGIDGEVERADVFPAHRGRSCARRRRPGGRRGGRTADRGGN